MRLSWLMWLGLAASTACGGKETVDEVEVRPLTPETAPGTLLGTVPLSEGECGPCWVVGSDARDLFRVFAQRIRHFDGKSWRDVPIPSPVNRGDLGTGVAAIERGKILIASEFGVATLESNGAFVDHSHEVEIPLADKYLNLGVGRLVADPAAGDAPMLIDTFSGRAWQRRAGAFVRLPDLPGELTGRVVRPGSLVQHGNTAWLSWKGERIYFDGERWLAMASEKGRDEAAFVDGLAVLRGGLHCPDWCATAPPYGVPFSNDVEVAWLAPKAGATARVDRFPITAFVANGSGYYAQHVRRARDGRASVVGCETQRGGSYSGKAVIHVLAEGAASRVPVPPIDCRTGTRAANDLSWDLLTLLDGTLVFFAGNYWEPTLALVAP